MIQSAAARLVFNEPKRAHVTPLFVSLHWLPVAARIQFKTLMLAYRTTTGSAPAYFHSLLRIYIPSRSLRSASDASWYHHGEAQNHSPEHSRSPFLAGGMIFPPPPECWNPVNLPATIENSSLSTLLLIDSFFFQHYTKLFLYFKSFSLPFSPSLASMYLFEQCLRLGVRGTNRFMYSPIVSRFG